MWHSSCHLQNILWKILFWASKTCKSCTKNLRKIHVIHCAEQEPAWADQKYARGGMSHTNVSVWHLSLSLFWSLNINIMCFDLLQWPKIIIFSCTGDKWEILVCDASILGNNSKQWMDIKLQKTWDHVLVWMSMFRMPFWGEFVPHNQMRLHER